MHDFTAEQIDRFWSKVNKDQGQGPDGDCWEWTAGMKTDGEYGGFYLSQLDNNILCHKFSFLLAHNFGLDEIPDDIVVRHSCNNPKCVRPNHLRLGTHKDNSRDMVEAGNSMAADKSPRAKVNWGLVLKIRELWGTGTHTFARIGRMLSLSACQVRQIALNRSWRDPYYNPPAFPKDYNRVKYSEEVVRAVREDREKSVPAQETVKQYGMSISQYYNIVRGDQRKEVVA